MEDKIDMLDILAELEEINRKNLRTARLQCLFMLICAVCCVAVLVMVLNFLPQVTGIITQMETVLSNLERTTDQLAALDLQNMVEDVDALVKTGQESLENMMTKLETVDFEKLNDAITDLAEIIEPLAKIFKAF